MGGSTLLSAVLLLGLLCITTSGCIEAERLALVKLKLSLKDPLDELSSWKGKNCCSWAGVGCHNHSGRVVRLKLDGKSLGGEINPSLVELKHLRSVDLSMNDFGGTRIPDVIGSLTELKYLKLSDANFGGTVPRQLGNLSNLLYLNLGSDYQASIPGLHVDALGWISNLSSLRYLGLNTVNLTKATDWLLSINRLAFVSVLKLSSCQIDSIPESLPFLNLTSLTFFDLSNNKINSTLPEWLFKMTHLTVLDLSENAFSGPISEAIGNMASLSVLNLQVNQLGGEIPSTTGSLCSLETLNLSWNNISGEMTGFVQGLTRCHPNLAPNLTALNLAYNSIAGPIPPSLGNFSSLGTLHLDSNKLSGTVPEGLGQLSQLTVLDISANSLVGVVSEIHFAKLSKLQELHISLNSLTLKVSSNWVPPFQLSLIYMQSCQLGRRFPPWLQTQIGVYGLDISNTGISDTLPDWFWNLTSAIMYLNLSHNQIKGRLPFSLEPISISIMDLSSNFFEGPLPRFNPDIIVLHLYDNSFSGPLPSDIGQAMPMLRNLLVSGNLINGTIPRSICEMMNLEVLGLADNLLYGRLPSCWSGSQIVEIVDLGNNNLSGVIPKTLGSMVTLVSLHLNNNSFVGEIPLSLKNCTGLVILDLGENSLSGSIPSWMGESFTKLMILRLRSNMFAGRIPAELSLLSSLRLLDMANNSLSGTIPPSFGNLVAMMEIRKNGDLLYEVWGSYGDDVLVYMKGRELEYSTTLALVTSIDLSSNGLVGEIPEELTKLTGLIALNLSNNRFRGEIPREIGKLRWLESLDFSRNTLSGTIPPTISALTFLSHMNLSYNNLRGRIPSGFQLQTLDDPSIYVGNKGLCGPPLKLKCNSGGESPSLEMGGGDEDVSEMIWFYATLAPGFAAGFSVFCAALLFNSRWRFGLFWLIDTFLDYLRLNLAANVTKLRRRYRAILGKHL